MVKYVKSSQDIDSYVGGELYSIYDKYGDISTEEDEQLLNDELENRNIEIDKFLYELSNYYVWYDPEANYGEYSIISHNDINDVFESMAIKDGVNVRYINQNGGEIVKVEITAYYNSREETVYLIPISDNDAEYALEYLEAFDSIDDMSVWIRSFFGF